jgi:16S rRNA (cytosine1402-N4)-methyltransferase
MIQKSIPPQHDDAGAPKAEDSRRLHIPVLLDNVVGLLQPQKGERYLDLTAGYGGHASSILKKVGDAHLLTLVDRDKHAISELQDFKSQGSRVEHLDFASAAEKFVSEHEQYDMVLVDLGVSSPQLDKAERGFSLKRTGPLDMRMDDRMGNTAGTIVNTMRLDDLQRVIVQYGEEPPRQAERIVTAIAKARPILTTTDLADVIASTFRGPYKKVHPATRTFQAIRIALNDELGQLSRVLPLLPRLLAPGGRVAIISFHSLEDRLVKRCFAEQASAGYEAELSLLTSRAIKGAMNDVHNPRARSAMLRAAVKTKK